MKIYTMTLALLVLLLPHAGAQASGLDERETERPQFAYRVMMGYILDKERRSEEQKPFAASILMTMGALSLGTAATIHFEGDRLSQEFTGYPMDPQIKLGTTVGFGIGGLAFLGLGGAVLALPPPNHRAFFADVLKERNPLYQEALAVSALKNLGAQARNTRLVSAWTFILTPLASTTFSGILNVNKGKPWYDGLSLNTTNISLLVSGLTSLFIETPEELLYAKYESAKAAWEEF